MVLQSIAAGCSLMPQPLDGAPWKRKQEIPRALRILDPRDHFPGNSESAHISFSGPHRKKRDGKSEALSQGSAAK